MTSESKHTAGPWRIESQPYGGPPFIRSADDKTVCVGARTIADARLIASAPELLEALEAFAKHFGPLHDNEWLNDECRHCFKLARNALSRVRGET